MGADNFAGLPGWVQAIASVAVFLVAIFFAVQGYMKKGGSSPPDNNAIIQAIGGSLGDRYAMKELTDAIKAVVAVLVLGTEESVRLRKVIENGFEYWTEEQKRFRDALLELIRSGRN